MEITITPTDYVFKFDYHPKIVERIKALPDRRYDPSSKRWFVPRKHQIEVEKVAHYFGFQMTATTQNKVDFDKIDDLPELTEEIPLKMTPRPYQKGGIAYGMLHKKVINGDDMGLGKTGQSIVTIETLQAFPCLVICPNSVKIGWQNQWREWTGRNYAMILNDSVKRNYQLYYESGMAKVFIVNYDSLQKFFVKSIDRSQKQLRLENIVFDERIKMFKSIIIDEIHNCCDFTTLRSKLVKGIANDKEVRLGLTGTPIVNRVKDLLVIMSIIGQIDKLGGYYNALSRYCSGPNKASNLKELNYLLHKHCFFRRLKRDVAKDLPPKERILIDCEITNRKEYDEAKNNFLLYLKKYKDEPDESIQRKMRSQALVQIGILKNIATRGKVKDALEFIQNLHDQGQKVVVYGHLKEILYDLSKHLKGSVVYTGDITSVVERQGLITKFQTDKKCNEFICGIKAAGTGTDGLQKVCTNTVTIEIMWTMHIHDQGDSRIDRIGKIGPSFCYYFLATNTIDERIWQIINRKKSLSNAVTGDEEETVTKSVMNELIDSFLNDLK